MKDLLFFFGLCLIASGVTGYARAALRRHRIQTLNEDHNLGLPDRTELLEGFGCLVVALLGSLISGIASGVGL